MELPEDFEKEIMPFVDETGPTPKDLLLSRLLEHAWEKRNIRSILNYLFGIPAHRFFKQSGRVRFE